MQSSPAWPSPSSDGSVKCRQAGLRTCSSCPATRARSQSRRPARRGRAQSPAPPGRPRSPGCGAPAARRAASGALSLCPASAHPRCVCTPWRSKQARPDADLALVRARAPATIHLRRIQAPLPRFRSRFHRALGFHTSGRSAAKKPSSPMVTRWLGSMRFTNAAISATQACTCSGHSGTWRAHARRLVPAPGGLAAVRARRGRAVYAHRGRRTASIDDHVQACVGSGSAARLYAGSRSMGRNTDFMP
jgi:hypothetical protein